MTQTGSDMVQYPVREGCLLFIDVSKYQGEFDYDAIRDSQVVAAVAKATEGTKYTDPFFFKNAARCIRNVIWGGAYHYFRPEQRAHEQAAHFYDVAEDATDIIPVTDFETLKGVAPRLAAQRVLEFIQHTNSAWNVERSLFYSYPYFIQQLLAQAPDEMVEIAKLTYLWIAHYKDPTGEPWNPGPWKDWDGWQWDGDGGLRLPNGVDADFNWFRGTRDDMAHRWVRTLSP